MAAASPLRTLRVSLFDAARCLRFPAFSQLAGLTMCQGLGSFRRATGV